LADGRVLIVGGADEREDPRPFDTAEFYHPGTGEFRPAAGQVSGLASLSYLQGF
jgi:hypothetical protein